MIRAFRDEDASAVTALLRTTLETPWVITDGEVVHWGDVPERARRAAWVAPEGAAVVGWADAQLRWEVSEARAGELWVAVAADCRGRGIGSALFAAAWTHLCDLGAQTVQTWSETDVGKHFLRARGFRELRQERISAVDPRLADVSRLADLEAAKQAEGFSVLPLGEVLDRARDVFAVYMVGEADAPGLFAEDNIAFEEWERERLASPSLDHEGSFVVVHDERPVAIAFMEVDRESRRATNDMTATLPEFRRRGLARLAKLASIRWAAELGLTSILTSNDRENPAMLALNDELGYRPTVVRGVFVRDSTV